MKLPSDHFQPQFYVKFTNEVSKSGDTVTYRLKVKKLGGGNSVENGSTPTSTNIIEREYDDFEFLHHTLTTQVTKISAFIESLHLRTVKYPT